MSLASVKGSGKSSTQFIPVPVCGHIGLTPQTATQLGGFKVQGKDAEGARNLINSAKDLEKAGAFMVVMECIPDVLGSRITKELSIPTIGIGAGKDCDGQVLVVNDILGLFEDFKPKFARRYAELGKEIRKACKKYLDDVKSEKFPSEDESY